MGHIVVSNRYRESVIDYRSYWPTCLDLDRALVYIKLRTNFEGSSRQAYHRLNNTSLHDPKIAANHRTSLSTKLTPISSKESSEFHRMSITDAL